MASESMDDLELRISELRSQVRRALASGDRETAATLRAELREAEYRWDVALQELVSHPTGSPTPSAPTAPSIPVREQVHQVLTLLMVPAAPKLIASTYEAFFAGGLTSPQMTSLRRDEERSFRSAPHTRPYYVCGALNADRLTAVRALLAISAWPLDHRIIGSLSPRVDFLTAAIRVAQHLQHVSDPRPQAQRLLWHFATNIPGAAESFGSGTPEMVISAAQAELEVHTETDRQQRQTAADRARHHLDETQQLFGGRRTNHEH